MLDMLLLYLGSCFSREEDEGEGFVEPDMKTHAENIARASGWIPIDSYLEMCGNITTEELIVLQMHIRINSSLSLTEEEKKEKVMNLLDSNVYASNQLAQKIIIEENSRVSRTPKINENAVRRVFKREKQEKKLQAEDEAFWKKNYRCWCAGGVCWNCLKHQWRLK